MNKNLYLNDSEKEWLLKVRSILSKPQPSIPPTPTPSIPNNEIWYKSSDGNVIVPHASGAFGANIVSNVYENEIGIITFDDDVTSIGYSAFEYCTGLTSITIPNSVTSIGIYAFEECSLTSITIPDSVTSIGEAAFQNCTSLTSITIPDSVTSIEDYTFKYCNSLTSITIPNSVTSIDNGAFNSCNSLTSITIPNSVTSIGEYAFADCTGLTSITSLNTTPPTISSNTLPTQDTYKIYVPAESVDTYKAATGWSDKASQIQAIQ